MSEDSTIRVSVSKRYKVSLLAPKGFVFLEDELKDGNYFDESEIKSLRVTLGGMVLTFETDTDYDLTGEDYERTLAPAMISK